MKKLIKRPRSLMPLAAMPNSDRAGSVLLVVIGLLGMLLLVGIAFYSFANSELSGGQFYADASKQDDTGLSPDKLWSFALEQLIVGTNDTGKANSALWGRRHALLSGILGRTGLPNYDGFDLTPYNGQGINLQSLPNGDPFVDQDYDGAADASQTLLNFNYSYAANGGSVPTVPTAPATDVDYTTPDINSLPLAFVGRGVDQTGTDVSVIIPSFHRPQLLRSGGAPIANWQTNPVTSQRVFRPHPNHICANGTNPRFLSAAGTNALGQTVNPFPFGTALTLKQGAWDLSAPPAGTLSYAWDADNDGDGVKEGIWMDLDFPVQSLSDGRMYVPLFSFTVLDADGLINLNVSGNQAGVTFPITGLPLANGRHVSRSNQGLSRAEISPAWAMLADPATDSASTVQHNLFWNTPSGSFSRIEMANTESLFLNIGRPDFTDNPTGTYTFSGGPGAFEPSKYYPGRYGELDLMARNQYTASKFGMAGIGDGGNRDFSMLPQPGRSAQLYGASGDDDSDSLIGQSRWDTSNSYLFMGSSFSQMQSNTAIPSFIHPLDYYGDGNNLSTVTSVTGRVAQLSSSGLATPIQWPSYASAQVAPLIPSYATPGVDGTGSGFINYLNAGAGNALLPLAHNGVIDEADEIIAEWELATTNSTMVQDEVFGPDNMLELHATDADLTTATVQARMRNLAPFNFSLAANAEAIRHQFTAASRDRKNFGMSPFVRRAWEFNTDSDGDATGDSFPPSSLAPYDGTTAGEPFRQALRNILFVKKNQINGSTHLAQLRLNLNRFLVGYDVANGPSVSVYGVNAVVGAPVYRELTAHPVGSLPSTPIVAATWNANSPSGPPSPNDQEYWARYDRQLMARDIYVMLYMFGGGQDTGTVVNYATTSNADPDGPMGMPRPLYTDIQLKEMAQFAVNVVDDLDRDNVMTRFEFDVDLSNGWNVDDNFSTTSETTDRLEVYGIERQELVISEFMGIKATKDTTGNHQATLYDESAKDTYFGYVELQNVSPFSVVLGNGGGAGTYNSPWRVTRQNSVDPTLERRLVLGNTLSAGTVPPGALFSIGTTTDGRTDGSGQHYSSDFRVNYDYDATTASMDYNRIVPNVPEATPPLITDNFPPASQLDLNWDADQNKFSLADGASTTLTRGQFFESGMEGDGITLILERRLDPNRAAPTSAAEEADNPWVEVDRMDLATNAIHEFRLKNADTGAIITTDTTNYHLYQLVSTERTNPLSRSTEQAIAFAASPLVANTWTSDNNSTVAKTAVNINGISSANSRLTAALTNYQLHFDRDFASVVDLLQVPLYGPEALTQRVALRAQFDEPSVPTAPTVPKTTSYLAQERFLRPLHIENVNVRLTNGDAVSLPVSTYDVPAINNRWYRLLEFTEVPNQTEQGLRTFPYAMRNSGAINLNTLRHRGVLAGLIDDPDNPNTPAFEGHHNPAYASEAVMLQDLYESRDWWLQYLLSRDGVDPLTQLILPGTAAGRPFRSLNMAERANNGLEDTVLRGLPLDMPAVPASPAIYADHRSLFEARVASDRPSLSGLDLVDPGTRHRLLRKVVNSSTTRSNVFIVWISTRYFEAISTSNGAGGSDIQIGDVLQGAPDHRGFFIVDRSLPEAGFQAKSGRFDFRKFVQYRKTLQ